MHALHLDFQDTRRRTSWSNWLLLFTGLAVSALLGYQFLQTRNAVDILVAKRSLLERTTHHNTRHRHLTPAQLQSMRAEIKDARAVLSQLRLPWGGLLKDIGASLDKHVALLAIVPDARKRTIKISGEAKNLSAVLDYIKSLQKAKSLGSVYLQNHQIVTHSAQRPVRFTLLASWEVTP